MVDMNVLDKRVSDLTVRELLEIVREFVREEVQEVHVQQTPSARKRSELPVLSVGKLLRPLPISREEMYEDDDR